MATLITSDLDLMGDVLHMSEESFARHMELVDEASARWRGFWSGAEGLHEMTEMNVGTEETAYAAPIDRFPTKERFKFGFPQNVLYTLPVYPPFDTWKAMHRTDPDSTVPAVPITSSPCRSAADCDGRFTIDRMRGEMKVEAIAAAPAGGNAKFNALSTTLGVYTYPMANLSMEAIIEVAATHSAVWAVPVGTQCEGYSCTVFSIHEQIPGQGTQLIDRRVGNTYKLARSGSSTGSGNTSQANPSGRQAVRYTTKPNARYLAYFTLYVSAEAAAGAKLSVETQIKIATEF